MSSEKFSAGRKAAIHDIKSIIKSSNAAIDEMDLSHFTGNKKALSKPEATSFFKQSSKNFFELVQKDLGRLEKGESTQQIRDIPPFSINEDTESAGKVSAYRDVYNMISSLTEEEVLLPVPDNISRWHKKKVINTQSEILSSAHTHLLQSVATKGQAETVKYENECAEAQAREQLARMGKNNSAQAGSNGHTAASRQDFNDQAAPARNDFANIDMDYVRSFEEKNLLHPNDMDQESLAYFHGLNEAITVIENYKSSIKNKQFSSGAAAPRTSVTNKFRRSSAAGQSNGSSPQISFCRTHSLEIINVAREAIVAMMKGADPHKICDKVATDSTENGFAKAVNDISCIVNEINPDKVGITHSHGYRLTTSPQLISRMAYTVTEQTVNEMSRLMEALGNARSANKVLQTGVVETMIRGGNPRNTQRRTADDIYDPS